MRSLRERTKTRWTGSSMIPRIVLFVLTLVCVAAAFGIIDLVGLPAKILTAIFCIAVAELLILRFALFRAGPDEALYPAAFLLLISALPGPPRDEGILLIAGAFLISGLRLRNSLYMAGSVAATLIYLAVASDGREIAALLSLALAFAAVALLNREWDHPAWPRLAGWCILLLPLLAWLLMTVDLTTSRPWVMIATGLVALLMLVSGVAIRRHPPLISGMILGALAIGEAGTRLTLPVYLRLMILGALLGAIVLLAQRMLGGRTTGVTAKPVAGMDLTLAEAAVAVAVAGTGARPSAEPQPQGGGGRYGGGGASGEF